MRPARLKTRPEFLEIAHKGWKIVSGAVILQGLKDDCAPMIGFTVTKKIGNSVVRNRVRRRLRAVIDRIFSGGAHVYSGRYVLIARASVVDRPFEKLHVDVLRAFARLQKISGMENSLEPPENP